jgi:hypothetical protein
MTAGTLLLQTGEMSVIHLSEAQGKDPSHFATKEGVELETQVWNTSA